MKLVILYARKRVALSCIMMIKRMRFEIFWKGIVLCFWVWPHHGNNLLRVCRHVLRKPIVLVYDLCTYYIHRSYITQNLFVLQTRTTHRYYSPKSFRQSKVIAAKMGLNTGWNTAISLRSSGEDSSDRRRHQDAARLPVGIDAIRKHLAEVDNVPLLVPLFTDCT